MHLDVQLRDEQGKVLRELKEGGHKLFRLMPGPHDPSYPYLRFVDPLDTTTFNRAQMAALVPELRRLAAEKSSDVLRDVLEMAELCEASLYTHLEFIGD